MRIKVNTIADQISTGLKKFACVESVLVFDDDLDIYDPYFVLTVDVFCVDTIPQVDSRRVEFGPHWAFETSLSNQTDSFVVDKIKVQIRYNMIDPLTQLLKDWEKDDWIYSPGETNLLYNLSKSSVFFSRTKWVEETREKLKNLPLEFWSMLQISLLSKMEKAYGDLKAADLKGDELFFTLSIASFLRCYSAMMFAINEEFEPDEKKIYCEIFKLPIVPEHFKSEYLGLCSIDREFSMARKLEVAKLLLESIAPMV